MKTTTFTSRSPQETAAIAGQLLARLAPGAVLALHGDLGSGKTCFVRGLAAALHLSVPVTSPTFTLIHEYPSEPPLYHMDLYRLGGPDVLDALGLDEYLDGDGITVIEWADRAGPLLPDRTIHIHFQIEQNHESRTLTVKESS
jgi:tRNA threonylcarbamoyladenosine biosynthesis protein TsaE